MEGLFFSVFMVGKPFGSWQSSIFTFLSVKISSTPLTDGNPKKNIITEKNVRGTPTEFPIVLPVPCIPRVHAAVQRSKCGQDGKLRREVGFGHRSKGATHLQTGQKRTVGGGNFQTNAFFLPLTCAAKGCPQVAWWEKTPYFSLQGNRA